MLEKQKQAHIMCWRSKNKFTSCVGEAKTSPHHVLEKQKQAHIICVGEVKTSSYHTCRRNKGKLTCVLEKQKQAHIICVGKLKTSSYLTCRRNKGKLTSCVLEEQNKLISYVLEEQNKLISCVLEKQRQAGIICVGKAKTSSYHMCWRSKDKLLSYHITDVGIIARLCSLHFICRST